MPEAIHAKGFQKVAATVSNILLYDTILLLLIVHLIVGLVLTLHVATTVVPVLVVSFRCVIREDVD